MALNPEMSYLYDSFNWDHCAAAGIPTRLQDSGLPSEKRTFGV